MPPNVAFGTSTPVPPAGRPATRRKRRYLAAGAMVVLMVSAFAVGHRIADMTEVAANPGRIQSAVLPMADEAAAAPSTTASCHPAYVDCVPHNLTDDIDCEDLAIADVRLHDVRWDPYELDRNGDGIGCEST